MTWPLVWRSTYEQALAWEPLYRRAMEDYDRIYKQNVTLNAVLLTIEPREPLRLVEKGHVATTVPRTPTPLDRRIEEVSEGDPRVKRHFWGLVTRLRKEGKTDGDILGEIRWQTTETE